MKPEAATLTVKLTDAQAAEIMYALTTRMADCRLSELEAFTAGNQAFWRKEYNKALEAREVIDAARLKFE